MDRLGVLVCMRCCVERHLSHGGGHGFLIGRGGFRPVQRVQGGQGRGGGERAVRAQPMRNGGRGVDAVVGVGAGGVAVGGAGVAVVVAEGLPRAHHAHAATAAASLRGGG